MTCNEKREIILSGVDALSSAGTVIFPPLGVIPLFTYGINRVLGLMNPDDIVKRIQKVENKLKANKISIDEFKEKIEELNEHDRYVLSSNLNNILINCIPETVDIYINIFIEMIMKEKDKDINEEICEIITQLNKNDLNTLKMINEYMENGTREYYNQNIKREEMIIANNKKIREDNKKQELKNAEIRRNNQTSKIKKIENLTMPEYHERSIRSKELTIFWKDFIKTFNLETPEMGMPLLFKTVDENDNESMTWAYVVKSFIKLESLGILNFDYLTTVGTSNTLNIDRFHISLFGKVLLDYIKKS